MWVRQRLDVCCLSEHPENLDSYDIFIFSWAFKRIPGLGASNLPYTMPSMILFAERLAAEWSLCSIKFLSVFVEDSLFDPLFCTRQRVEVFFSAGSDTCKTYLFLLQYNLSSIPCFWVPSQTSLGYRIYGIPIHWTSSAVKVISFGFQTTQVLPVYYFQFISLNEDIAFYSVWD